MKILAFLLGILIFENFNTKEKQKERKERETMNGRLNLVQRHPVLAPMLALAVILVTIVGGLGSRLIFRDGGEEMDSPSVIADVATSTPASFALAQAAPTPQVLRAMPIQQLPSTPQPAATAVPLPTPTVVPQSPVRAIVATPRPTATRTSVLATAIPTATPLPQCEGLRSVDLRWVDFGDDRVGIRGFPNSDGHGDGHFKIALDVCGNMMLTNFVLRTTNAGGAPKNGQVWDTTPLGHWILGVYRGSRRLNTADVSIEDVVSGVVTYDVYANDSGFFNPGQHYGIVLRFKDGTEARAVTVIPEPTPTPTAIPPTPAVPTATATVTPTSGGGEMPTPEPTAIPTATPVVEVGTPVPISTPIPEFVLTAPVSVELLGKGNCNDPDNPLYPVHVDDRGVSCGLPIVRIESNAPVAQLPKILIETTGRRCPKVYFNEPPDDTFNEATGILKLAAKGDAKGGDRRFLDPVVSVPVDAKSGNCGPVEVIIRLPDSKGIYRKVLSLVLIEEIEVLFPLELEAMKAPSCRELVLGTECLLFEATVTNLASIVTQCGKLDVTLTDSDGNDIKTPDGVEIFWRVADDEEASLESLGEVCVEENKGELEIEIVLQVTAWTGEIIFSEPKLELLEL